MKSLKEILAETEVSPQNLQMFVRLIDQNYKNPEDKVKAMAMLANLVLGKDVKKLASAIMSPPPLPTGASPISIDTTKIQN